MFKAFKRNYQFFFYWGSVVVIFGAFAGIIYGTRLEGNKPVVIKHIKNGEVTIYHTTAKYFNRTQNTISFKDEANKNRLVILSGDFIVEYPEGQ